VRVVQARVWIVAAAVSACGIVPALPQAMRPSEKTTVGTLLAQDYAIVGTTSSSSGGAGLFLRKGSLLYFCFVTETPQSPKVTTNYCKPVE